MGASKGWEISESLNSVQKMPVLFLGLVYFLFDGTYEYLVRANTANSMIMIISFPLFILNALIVYVIFSSLLRTFEILKRRK